MKKNTLFNYFSPSSITKTTKKISEDNSDDNKRSLKLIKSAEKGSKKKTTKSPSTSSAAVVGSKLDRSEKRDCVFNPGDIVWSRLFGYPWWPSLVCSHPTKNIHHTVQRNVPQVHVQFYDDPPNRGWVPTKNIQMFTGASGPEVERGGVFFSTDPSVLKGALQAEGKICLSNEDRLKDIVFIPSEDEDESGEAGESDIDDGDENSAIESHDSDKNKNIAENTGGKKRRRAANHALIKQKIKKRKLSDDADELLDDDSSGDEFNPGSQDSSDDEVSSGVDESKMSRNDSQSHSDNEPSPSPVMKVKKNNESLQTPVRKKFLSNSSFVTPSTNSPSLSNETMSKLSTFSPEPTQSSGSEVKLKHLTFDFLRDNKIRDMSGRPCSHVNYDHTTLNVPDSFLNSVTPGHRQWWQMKIRNFDSVLFFKVGKFYELYHMDAVVGVTELNLTYMKGDYAHSGFPEIAYSRMSDALVQKGYKVARVEQTETPQMAEERCKKSGRSSKFDKVVRREICQITTLGTKTLSFINGDCSEASNRYLMAVTEKVIDYGCSEYGVSFVDVSIGKFHIGQFKDDRHSSRFRTLIAHHVPVEIIYDKNQLSVGTQSILNTSLNSTRKEVITSADAWNVAKTLKLIAENEYFTNTDPDSRGQRDRGGGDADSGELINNPHHLSSWPQLFNKMIDDSDCLGLKATDCYQLGLSAFSGCVFYLRNHLIDMDLLSMKLFEEYSPLDDEPLKQMKTTQTINRNMVLDGVTLTNLDVIDMCGSGEGTLLHRLDHCHTAFGKRLLKHWLCAPLTNSDAINERLNSIKDLMNATDLIPAVIDILKKLPDLERLLGKIHTLGLKNHGKHHPDSRAIFFEDAIYSQRKITDLMAALEGFQNSFKIVEIFEEHKENFKSSLLRQCISVRRNITEENEAIFPDLTEYLKYFKSAFDHKKAKETGKIIPSPGVDIEYDTAMKDLKTTHNSLEEYLQKQRIRLGCKNINYWGQTRNRYQLEVPDSALKHTPDEYMLKSQKKGFKRFWTKDIEIMFAEVTDAETRRDFALRDTLRNIFSTFDNHYNDWESAVQCLAIIDVLISLMQYSLSTDGPMCRPKIINNLSPHQKPYLVIRGARHPCVSKTYTGGDFIPNDTVIGIRDENDTDGCESDASCVLVTGPNMGGKSTLMRQVGLVVILAQLGCYVPGEQCVLTPVDRLFTRLGASDRIMSGESTFYVELSETASILQHATTHSLVLIDELGRGTATYDGTAIACAVVKELSDHVKCRTLFSTHYHSLVDEFNHDPNVRLGHMACMVENEDEDDPTKETILFLYKFISGSCPKSYGFNAARLANIPDQIIVRAKSTARDFEMSVEERKLFREMMKVCLELNPDSSTVLNLQTQINSLSCNS